MTQQRVNLDAALERSVIRGTLTAATGERRDFHGWLELNTALEALLATSADHPPHPFPATQSTDQRLRQAGGSKTDKEKCR